MFFKLHYTRLDPSTSLYMSILVQAGNLKSQVVYYDSSLGNYTDYIQKIYVFSSGEEFQIVIDTDASNNSTTPNYKDLIGKFLQSNFSSLK